MPSDCIAMALPSALSRAISTEMPAAGASSRATSTEASSRAWAKATVARVGTDSAAIQGNSRTEAAKAPTARHTNVAVAVEMAIFPNKYRCMDRCAVALAGCEDQLQFGCYGMIGSQEISC